MSELIISVSGLRGIVGESLTPSVAANYAMAFAEQLGKGPIVLSRDGRATGRMLADAIRAALAAVGRQVLDAEIAATPTTGRLVRQQRAAGGIQISASHNPAPYNGMKLFGPDGSVVPAAVGQRVLEAYHRGHFGLQRHDKIGSVIRLEDTTTDHLQAVLRHVDVERIRAAKYPVLLDSNHGAGSVLGQILLEHLHCPVTLLGGEPDGKFAHTPEPTAENLQGVLQEVIEQSAVAGFCQDPDADRLALIDEKGRYVGEEFTLAVCLNHVLQSRRGPVVTNCSTSRMSRDIAAKYDVPFFMSQVGEAHVTAMMREKNAVFGGEGNGGPIDPEVGYVRDSFVAMAYVLDAMSATGKSLSQLVDELPRYEIYKTKIAMTRDEVAAAMDRLVQHFSAARPDSMDGLRLDWEQQWLLVRASNTEPIVRIICEAPSLAKAQALAAEAEHVLCDSANEVRH